MQSRPAALGVLLSALALLLLAIPAGAKESIDQQVHDVAKTLQCPVCQNLSVADSPSQLATDMRTVIREKLEQGETPDQIRAYFVQQYGEGILITPEPHGFGLFIWWQPILILLGGALILGFAFNRWTSWQAGYEEPTEADLDAYDERIRAELERARGEA